MSMSSFTTMRTPRRDWRNNHEPPVAANPGAALLGAICQRPRHATAARPLLIEIKGSRRGEAVWFRPLGLVVAQGETIRFVNRNGGNSHTATAYHSGILDRPWRIPARATLWDSILLLPDQGFDVSFTVPGVYDLYCQSHEHAGIWRASRWAGRGRIPSGRTRRPNRVI